MDRVDRRTFLKSIVAATAMLAPLLELKATTGEEALKKASRVKSRVLWGMALDISKCVRCGRCVVACKEKNKLPEDIFFNKLAKVSLGGRIVEVPLSCMHCRYPPCMYVCPVGATYRREDGVVLVNYNVCIGCRYCMIACPYGARVYIDRKLPLFPKGVVAKCNLCIDRIEKGLKPACVEACPYGARLFGELEGPQ